MGKATVIKIYCKNPETRVELKKIAAEFGTYERALTVLIKLYKENPYLVKREVTFK